MNSICTFTGCRHSVPSNAEHMVKEMKQQQLLLTLEDDPSTGQSEEITAKSAGKELDQLFPNENMPPAYSETIPLQDNTKGEATQEVPLLTSIVGPNQLPPPRNPNC